MLTIPSTIKTLYQTDGTRKNFRVHFPNGEYSDITNSNVVQESVKFTESLSSQSTFKFGLAEASVLEFETVGVGNMFGMTIEASMEIDTSSLSAADIAAIRADEGDGKLNEPYYSIPLGTFIVSSCPRNHGAMAHRQVTAYSTYGGSKDLNSPFETGKLKLGGKGSYTPNLDRLIYAALGWRDPSILSGLTKTTYGTWENFPTEGEGDVYEYTQGNYRYQSIVAPTWVKLVFGSVIPADKLYSLEIDPTQYYSAMYTYNNLVEQTFRNVLPTWVIDNFKAQFALRLHVASPYTNYGPIGKSDNLPVFYPKYVTDITVRVPVKITVQIIRYNTQNPSDYTTMLSRTFDPLISHSDPPASYLYQYTDNFDSATLNIEPTGTDGSDPSYIDSYDFNNILQGWLEANAMFCSASRNGGVKLLRLDDSSPVSIVPDNYSECWWDEYDVDPIGAVTITYKDDQNKENTTEISIGNGASQYDMSGNEMLKNLSATTRSDITTLINDKFKPYAGTVTFTPTELTMQGWPWLEAGDALEIEAEDGTEVETYALRVEMSGIQNLQSAITAEGGEIIEEVG